MARGHFGNVGEGNVVMFRMLLFIHLKPNTPKRHSCLNAIDLHRSSPIIRGRSPVQVQNLAISI